MKKTFAFLIIIFTFVCASCDDGRIYEENVSLPEEGRVVKLTGLLSGAGNWSSGYTVVIAGFNDESDYAVIAKAVPAADTREVVLSGISEEVTKLELCVISRLRKRVVTFRTFDCPVTADTIRVEAGTLNVGMYAAIQDRLFNTTCANCHGASTQAAAGLFLTEGKSHAALVGQPSLKVPGELLVEPGKASRSVLYQALFTDLSAGWNYDHTKEVLSSEMEDVLEDWIDDGAKE